MIIVMMYLKHFFVICLCSLNWSCSDVESSEKTSLVNKSVLMGKLRTCISSGEPVSSDVLLFLILFMQFLGLYCAIWITSAIWPFKKNFSPYFARGFTVKNPSNPLSSLGSGLSLDRRLAHPDRVLFLISWPFSHAKQMNV